MKLSDIKKAIEHLMQTNPCPKCKKKYKNENIQIIATTKTEGLFEIFCPNCKTISIVSVFLGPGPAIRDYRPIKENESISQNDILDVKNFLNNFDGNFKNIFIE